MTAASAVISAQKDVTKQQNRIITAPPDQHVCITASPGSGKTTTIIMRIVHMFKYLNVSLSEICLLTYNKSLAQDMIEKLKCQGIDHKELGWCGTLHALCYRETQKYGTLTPWIEKFKDCSEVYPALKYIIFDEYQDADASIASVVEILSRNKYLTIIGDDRQQLYSYKGANANLLLELKGDFVKYPLTRSFRCNVNICNLLSRFYPSYPLIKSKIDGPRPKLYRSFGRYLNNPDIIEEIVKIVNESKEGSIAIISPVVNSDKTAKYLNDIHSNVEMRCGVHFECIIGEMRDHEIQTDGSQNVITSIHSAKGKEYDTVIVLNVIDAQYAFEYPSPDALSKLFVALSRARQNLHVFEHLFSWHVGSLRWISDNEDLFDHVQGWSYPTRRRLVNGQGSKPTRKCTDFIRSLTVAQREILFSDYHEEQLIEVEKGLETHFGPPDLFGTLIKILLSIKLRKEIPSCTFQVYITSAEWKKILRHESLHWLDHKINLVYPFPVIKIIFPDVIFLIDMKGSKVGSICEENIISSLMDKEYYNYLPTAHSVLSQLTCNIDEANIKNIWWVVRFLRLTQLSVIGFTKPDLNPYQIQLIINYVNGCTLLDKLNIKRYHRCVVGGVQLEEKTIVTGEIDFETEDSLIEIKCYSPYRSLEDTWLQAIICNLVLPIDNLNQRAYHKISSASKLVSDIILNESVKPTTKYQCRTLYVYNAITGQLWRRYLK